MCFQANSKYSGILIFPRVIKFVKPIRFGIFDNVLKKG